MKAPLTSILKLSALPFMVAPCLFGAAQHETFKKLEPFLSKHCYECHDGDVSKGDLNLYDLNFEPNNPNNFEVWERVYDRIHEHEMPPKKKKQPESEARKSFLNTLKKPLVSADIQSKQSEGRVQLRRLTRREYENTVHDLLSIDIPLTNMLPEDPATHGFETVSDGQQLSHFTMKHYLDVADLSLDEAFDRAFGKEEKFSKTYSVDDLTVQKGYGNFRGPEKIGKYSVAYRHNLQFYGRLMRTRAPESGWYEVTLKELHAINPQKGVVWGTLKSGTCSSNSPMLYRIGLIEATPEKRDVTYRAWIEKGHALELKANDVTYKRAKSTGKGGNISYKNTNNKADGVPGIAVSSIHVKRIYPNAKAENIRKSLLGSVKWEALKKAKGTPEFQTLINKAIQSFAYRAFRRGVDTQAMKPYLELAKLAAQENKEDLSHPLRIAYRAILCSPRFLTFIEKPGKLDSFAIASRLSYMLWNSKPDYLLMRAARDKKLETKEQIIAQADRMLKDRRADRFIESFTDQWLSLNKINETTPDNKLYRTYDEIIEASMLAETRAFFKELIQKDLPIQNVIQSNFNMLNERLARHYKVDSKDIQPGQGIQKVKSTSNYRNGLVTQGALLKVTANGTTTSPVLRGVWMAEKILGYHIPPPPTNVPAIEPDIRGAKSIRDELSKHTENESCASCHQKIDGTGFAFENFDPVGSFRTKYGNKKNSAKVNPAGVTPSGKSFKNIQEWKQHYVKEPQKLAKTFAKQLITYATGAAPSFSDRYPLYQITEEAAKNKYGMRSILNATITSSLFSRK